MVLANFIQSVFDVDFPPQISGGNQMSKNVNYSKFKNIEGNKPNEGEVLVPVLAEELIKWNPVWKKNQENLTTFKYQQRRVRVGFVIVPKEQEKSALKSFNYDVNQYLESTRRQRCLITNKKGNLIRCPKCNNCKSCTRQNDSNMFNSRTISLDKMLEDMNDDSSYGLDPTGITDEYNVNLLTYELSKLIKKVSDIYPEAEEVFDLLINDISKKDIIKLVNFKCSKTQSYERIKKMQRYLKKLYQDEFK
ncbi:hypothetical protein C7U54_12645 [Faecalibacillus intestinalis]|uniref:Uncharacterized protein n=2 Tax=Faecalibacillus intestinalis TaxID=1982626 RepID=A0A2T3FPE5_9FIRM|nr:hypothetical protein C7U54_12645 [Faecalibacillus intestinalis]RGG79017.1 hypothetical protein DWW80_12930 [Coprobacillus sp. AF17-17AC]RGG83002.1 hypothetical protein DWW76_13500 [Coprobacillus sp. AF17-11AC]